MSVSSLPSRAASAALTLAAGAGAALPVLASLRRALADHWMPAGDQGIIATRAYDVFTSHTPLVGQYSLVSQVTRHLTYSPGPMLYWLIALPARFGSPGTIALTIALANALSVLGIVAIARRRGGVVLMLLTALALAFMCRSFMPEALHDNWNPSAGLLPFALLVFLAWSLACGDAWALPAVALVGSFTAQCQVAFLAPTLGLLGIGLAGLALSRRGRGRGDQAAPAGEPGQTRESGRARSRAQGGRRLTRQGGRARIWPPAGLWPWALAGVLVLAACWTPPVLDQMRHSPGNLTLLYRAATRHSHTLGSRAGERAVIRAVGVPPRWLRVPGDPFDTRLPDVTTKPSPLATVSTLALLAALLIAGALGAWRRRVDIAAAAAIGLLLCGAFFLVASSTPVASEKVLGYTLWWGSVAGMWVWLALVWAAFVGVRAAATRTARLRAGAVRLREARRGVAMGLSAVGCAVVVAAGAVIAAGQPRDAHSAEYGPIASIARQLDRAPLPAHSTIWLRASLGGVAAPLSQAIKFLLRRQNVRILQQGAIARLGPWYELDRRAYDRVVYAYDDRSLRHPPRGRLLARVALRESRPPFPGARPRGGVRIVSVVLAPAHVARH